MAKRLIQGPASPVYLVDELGNVIGTLTGGGLVVDQGAGGVSPWFVGGRAFPVTVTPTLSVAGAYVANDYVGTSGVAGVIAGAARIAGGSGVLEAVVLEDDALQSAAGEIWLFDTAITPPNDNAAWTLSDAHAKTMIPGGVIPLSTYYASALNSVAPAKGLGISYTCVAGSTSLYFVYVTRGTPTYASGNLTFRFSFMQD